MRCFDLIVGRLIRVEARTGRWARMGLMCVLLIAGMSGCATRPSGGGAGRWLGPGPGEVSEMQVQSLEMGIAEDYIAAVTESIYMLHHTDPPTASVRVLEQSFLRNTVGASLDIAVGPNPVVNLLDLLVLVSLQAHTFEAHWMPAGIGERGVGVLAVLRKAEQRAWSSASSVMTPDQLAGLRELIDTWIQANPDQMVASLVRFEEFTEQRQHPLRPQRVAALSLLRDVTASTQAVDDVRLLGERLVWYAGFYPYVLGQQAELTAYRLAAQPEVAELGTAITGLADRIDANLADQQDRLFAALAQEREAATQGLQDAVAQSIDQAAQRFAQEREATLDQTFERFAQERQDTLDALESNGPMLESLTNDLRDTAHALNEMAPELRATTQNIDSIVARFDDPLDDEESTLIRDVQSAAVATGDAADRITLALEQSNILLADETWDRRLAESTTSAGAALIDRVFWRCLILILTFAACLAVLRYIPRRKA